MTGIAGDVGANTRHYLEVLDKFRDDPEYGYRYHHWVASSELIGPSDPDTFKQAVRDVAEASPVLRSYFEEQNGVWKQCIAPSLPDNFFEVREYDTGTDWRTVIANLTEALNETVLPVTDAPIFKIIFHSFSETTIVTVHIHHGLVDSWGLIVFYQQLVRAYDAALAATSHDLPQLSPETFLSIALEEENQWTNETDRQEKLSWWKNTIGDHTYVTAPLPEPPGYMEAVFGGLSPSVSAAVKSHCDGAGIHFSYVVRAAYVKALQTWTGSDDVLMTSVKANRSDRSADVAANLAHWLIARHSMPRATPLREMSVLVRDQVNEAKDHYLPYWDIVQAVCPEQYFCNFGITPFSFNYLPPVNMEITSGAVTLKGLLEFMAFSRRAITTEFFPRCLDSIDPATHQPIIAIDNGYNRETMDQAKAQGVLDEVVREINEAFQ